MVRLILFLLVSIAVLSPADPSCAKPPVPQTTWMKAQVVSLALDSISVDGARPQHIQRVEALRRNCGDGEDQAILLWSNNTVVPMQDGWGVRFMSGMPWLLPGDELLVGVIPMIAGRDGFSIKEAWLVDGESGCDGEAAVRDISRYDPTTAGMALSRVEKELTYLEATVLQPRLPLETEWTVREIESGDPGSHRQY